jgi:hypothetical protein
MNDMRSSENISMLKRISSPTLSPMGERLLVMLQLQRMNNDRMDEQWYSHRPPFLRAAIMAAADAMNQYGYKWWEQKYPDIPKVRLALVDAFHFVISHEMLEHGRRDAELAKIAGELENMFTVNLNIHLYEGLDFAQKMDAFIARAAAGEAAMWPALFSAMADVGMEWEVLSRMSFSRNVLILFRQDYGHREGTYSQIWNGKEDAVHLEEIIESMPSLDATTVRLALVSRYAKATTGRRATDR